MSNQLFILRENFYYHEEKVFMFSTLKSFQKFVEKTYQRKWNKNNRRKTIRNVTRGEYTSHICLELEIFELDKSGQYMEKGQ